MRHTHNLLILPLGLALFIAGCDREPDVQRYTARVDPAPPPPVMPVLPAMTGGTAAPLDIGTLELAWDLPTGWTETGESNQFRLTTFRAGQGTDAVELAVSRVPGPAGSITENVNRWRRQLGLPELTKEEVVPLVTYANNDTLPAFLTDQRNDQQRALIAWFSLDQASWFFKATGNPAAIDAQREGFDALIASIRPNEHAGHNHGPAQTHVHNHANDQTATESNPAQAAPVAPAPTVPDND